MSDETAYERWYEYECVECEPVYERPFVLAMREIDEAPEACPRCGAFRSLRCDGVRQVLPYRHGRPRLVRPVEVREGE